MKPRIVRSRVSEEDLDDIWQFIARDSVFHAERFIRFVDERIQHLARHPLIGRPRHELAGGIRSFPVRHLVVYYRALDDGIEIVRILHSSRELKQAIYDPESPGDQ